MGVHADLFERHKAVLPRWAPLYYEQPIAIPMMCGSLTGFRS